MAMNYAWQERKKFAIPVAAGAGVVLIWLFFILSGINAAAEKDYQARNAAESQLRFRLQAGVPTDDSVGSAERDKGTLQKDLQEIQEKLVFRVEEAFRAKEGQNLRTRFGSQRQAVSSKLETLKSQRNVDFNGKLLFPSTIPDLPDPVMSEWLVRLAVIQRIATFSIDCGVASLAFVEVIPDEHQEEPTVPAGQFHGVLSIKFKVTGTSETIIKLLHGLQVEGPNFLAIEGAEVTSADPTRNLLGAVITAGAMVVTPDGALKVEAKE